MPRFYFILLVASAFGTSILSAQPHSQTRAEEFENDSTDCSSYPWMPACQSDNYFDGGWSDGHYRKAKDPGSNRRFRSFRGGNGKRR